MESLSLLGAGLSSAGSLLAAETAEGIVKASGWFLDNAWLVPAFPALSFLVILFFGKRFPKGGSEVGIAAVALSFVFAAAAGNPVDRASQLRWRRISGGCRYLNMDMVGERRHPILHRHAGGTAWQWFSCSW